MCALIPTEGQAPNVSHAGDLRAMTEPLDSTSDGEDLSLESAAADWHAQQQDVPGDLDERR